MRGRVRLAKGTGSISFRVGSVLIHEVALTETSVHESPDDENSESEDPDSLVTASDSFTHLRQYSLLGISG